MDANAYWQKAVAAFHDGVHLGKGATDTVQASAPGASTERRSGPYWRALAVAGLAGLALTGTPQANHPTDPVASTQSRLFGVGSDTVRMTSSGTISPMLEVMNTNLSKFNPDVQYTVVDLRDGSETFGDGVEATLGHKLGQIPMFKEGVKAHWNEVDQVAFMVPKGADQRADASGPAYSCTVILGGPTLTGDVNHKASLLAGLTERDIGGTAISNTPQDGRINVGVSDESFDNFTSWHEVGHCTDKATRYEVVTAETSQEEGAYMAHRREAYGDVFATIAVSVKEGNTQTAERMADLRTLGAVLNGATPNINTDPNSGGPRYYTTPEIEAAVKWVKEAGIDAVRDMPPQERSEKVRQIVEQTLESREEFSTMRRVMRDTRLGADGKVVFSPEAGAWAGRFQQAANHLGYTPQIKDFPEFRANKPAWKAAADRSTPDDWKLAPQVKGIELGHWLAEDLHAGARFDASDIQRTGSSWKVKLHETDGSVTSATVSKDGDVVRYDAAGHNVSLSDTRAAVQPHEGEVVHKVDFGDGFVDTADAQTVWRVQNHWGSQGVAR